MHVIVAFIFGMTLLIMLSVSRYGPSYTPFALAFGTMLIALLSYAYLEDVSGTVWFEVFRAITILAIVFTCLEIAIGIHRVLQAVSRARLRPRFPREIEEW